MDPKQTKKAAILKELESIRAYLNEDNEKESPDEDDLPILTDSLEDEPNALELENQHSDEHIVQDAYREEISLAPVEQNQELPVLDENLELEEEKTESSEEQHDLELEIEEDGEPDAFERALAEHPEQTSIFDAITEEVAEAAMAKEAEQSASAKTEVSLDSKSQKTRETMAGGENPFLPPHIRKQLGKHKGVNSELQKLSAEAVAQSQMLKQSKSHEGHKPAPIGDDEIDQLVDDLVASYLPKIEYALKLELKKRLEKRRQQDS